MRSVLAIIDVQREFCQGVRSGLAGDIAVAADGYDLVLATRSVNTAGSVWRDLLGWDGLHDPSQVALADEIEQLRTPVLDKDRYSAVPELLPYLLPDDRVDVCGLDTDACVLATALGLFDVGVDVHVLTTLCSSSGGHGAHEAGLTVLRRQLGRRRVH